MFSGIPSLPAIRTFEAAARLGSFKAAAVELSVSATAVSHQVRALEEQLQVSLFVRRTRAVELTEAGVRLAQSAHNGLGTIRDAVEDIRSDASVVRVTTIPAFATLRLAPALASFERLHPTIKVEIDMSADPVDLRRDRRFDIAIRYGTGPYPGLTDDPLVDERFFAYCAPSLAKTSNDPSVMPRIETVWAKTPLPPVTWDDWFNAAGWPLATTQPASFEEELFVVQAAIAGQGAALISDALVGDLVARGLLVKIQEDVSVPGIGYRALYHPEKASSAKIVKFTGWLKDTFSTRH